MSIHRFRAWRGTGHRAEVERLIKIQRVRGNRDQFHAMSVRDLCAERAFSGRRYVVSKPGHPWRDGKTQEAVLGPGGVVDS